MVASLLTGQPPSGDLADLLRPEPLPDGSEPEERLIALRPDGSSYERVARCPRLPKLDVALLERCVGIESWRAARQAFRSGLEQGK